MKLWEVMRLLEEDPAKVFEANQQCKGLTVRMRVDAGFAKYFKFEVFNGARLIDQSLGGGTFNGNVGLDLDWQLVKQPITWQEAIQAWADGNNLKICFADNVYTVRGGEPMRIDKNDITSGTWYVED